MKTHQWIAYPVALMSASILLLSAFSAVGQDQGQGRRGGGFGGALANMTEEQRTALQEMNQETRELNRRLGEARAELNNAIFAEKVDEAKIKEKAAAVAKVEAELAVARAKAFAKIRSKFTSEQIEALKNMPMGGRGFGGGGRRGGQQQ